MSLVAFILAAGRSSRMKSSISKISLPFGGRRLLDYSLDAAKHWAGNEVYCVLPRMQNGNTGNGDSGNGNSGYHAVIQEKPLGTGDAFALAFQAAIARDPDFLYKDILVLLADSPLIQADDITPIMEKRQKYKKNDDPSIIVMGMRPPNPGPYGRLIVNEQDRLVSIIEAKNADSTQLSVSLCNTGTMLIRAKDAQKAISMIKPNPVTGEYYLTDIIQHVPCAAVVEGPWQVFMGINTQEQLSEAEQQLQQRFRKKAMANGVLLVSPETTYLAYDTEIAPDTIIYPFTYFGPGVVLERAVKVHSFSSLTECHIKENSSIGPFAHIRKGSVIGPDAVIGNFVETKNTTVGCGSQAKHLSYLGDAIIGDSVNIGAGVITCNYDGHNKHITTIQSGTLIGSNVSLIAPVTIEEQCTIGAGSVITKNVPKQTLAVARIDQKNLPLSAQSKHLQRRQKNKSKNASEYTLTNDK